MIKKLDIINTDTVKSKTRYIDFSFDEDGTIGEVFGNSTEYKFSTPIAGKRGQVLQVDIKELTYDLYDSNDNIIDQGKVIDTKKTRWTLTQENNHMWGCKKITSDFKKCDNCEFRFKCYTLEDEDTTEWAVSGVSFIPHTVITGNFDSTKY